MPKNTLTATSPHELAKKGLPGALHALAIAGWNFNEEDKKGLTPIDYAVQGVGPTFERTVSELLRLGASPMRVNTEEITCSKIKEIIQARVEEIQAGREARKAGRSRE